MTVISISSLCINSCHVYFFSFGCKMSTFILSVPSQSLPPPLNHFLTLFLSFLGVERGGVLGWWGL